MGSIPEDRYLPDSFGALVHLPSAGPLAVMTRDQLHPPMIDDESYWSDGDRWYEAAVLHVQQTGATCRLLPGNIVLDVGAGLCGPSRQLASLYTVNVIAINKVQAQSLAARKLCLADPTINRAIQHIVCDANLDWPLEAMSVDCVWSMNMLYHLHNHPHFISEAARVLRSGGRIMIDDWVYTGRSSTATADTMAYHFGSSNLATVNDLLAQLEKNKFATYALNDLGHIARTHMKNHARWVIINQFRPRMHELDARWGAKLADDFLEAVEATIMLYDNYELNYVQMFAVKQL